MYFGYRTQCVGYRKERKKETWPFSIGASSQQCLSMPPLKEGPRSNTSLSKQVQETLEQFLWVLQWALQFPFFFSFLFSFFPPCGARDGTPPASHIHAKLVLCHCTTSPPSECSLLRKELIISAKTFVWLQNEGLFFPPGNERKHYIKLPFSSLH